MKKFSSQIRNDCLSCSNPMLIIVIEFVVQGKITKDTNSSTINKHRQEIQLKLIHSKYGSPAHPFPYYHRSDEHDLHKIINSCLLSYLLLLMCINKLLSWLQKAEDTGSQGQAHMRQKHRKEEKVWIRICNRKRGELGKEEGIHSYA